MTKSDKTVYDSKKTAYDSEGTVVDAIETVTDDATALGGAAIYDNGESAPQTEKEAPIEKGRTLLDTYQIESNAIEGGMGKVWRVHHTGWNVDLAMKQPKAKYFETEKQKGNFISECESWINLGLHPHIVSCYYVREIGGIPTIFSEWMDGGSLKNIIEDGSLYEGDADEHILDIAIQFARGLHYAHEQGLIHQDVKPDNLLLNKNGEAKVADFGIAKARAELTVLDEGAPTDGTMFSQSGGYTPAYCSMEQMNGMKLTRRTDIYSWAVAVMEMYLGERPWTNGVIAGAACDNYFSGTRIDIPEDMKALLKESLNADETKRPHDFMEIEKRLLEIYKGVTGIDYLRVLPKAAADTADSLNNKALSFLDMGNPYEAEKCWEKALQIDTYHSESTYNYALHLWRSAKIGDAEAVRRIQVSNQNNQTLQSDYYLARIHLERGDGESAISLLRSALEKSGGNEAIEEAIELANDPDENWGVIRTLSSKRTDEYAGADKALAVSISPDGMFAVSGVRRFDFTSQKHDHLVVLWDIKNGNCSLELKGHTDGIRSIAFSPDGRYVLSGSKDKTVKLWSIKEGKCLYSFEGHTGTVQTVSFSPDGKYILSGSEDKTIRLWDADKGKALRIFETDSHDIASLCFSSDGRYVLSGSKNNSIKLWDFNTGECLKTVSGFPYSYSTYHGRLSPDGRYVLSGGWNQPMVLWNFKTGEYIRSFTSVSSTSRSFYSNGGDINAAIEFSPDGKYILSAGEKARLWEVDTGRCIRTLESRPVSTAYFCPDRRMVMLGDAEEGKPELHILPRFTYKAEWMLCRISSVDESMEKERIFSKIMKEAETGLVKKDITRVANVLKKASEFDGYAEIPDFIKYNNSVGRYSLRTGFRTWKRVNVFRIKPELLWYNYEGIFVLKKEGNNFIVLELISGKNLGILKGLSPASKPVFDIGHDRKYLVSVSSDNLFQKWDLNSGECLYSISCGPIYECDLYYKKFVSLSSDGKHLLFSLKETMFGLWDVNTGNCLKVFSSESCRYFSANFSPDGRYVLYASGYPESKIRMWDIQNKENLRIFSSDSHGGVSNAFFCPNGRHIISYGIDRTMKLWHAETGECLRTFDKNPDSIYSACFSPEGRYIFTGHYEETMKVWDTANGECLRAYEADSGYEHTNAKAAGGAYDFISFSPDGNDIVAVRSKYPIIEHWRLDWEYEFPGFSDWDEGARPYLEIFLTMHPDYNNTDFESLISELQNRGCGWIRPEGIKRKLKEIAGKS